MLLISQMFLHQRSLWDFFLLIFCSLISLSVRNKEYNCFFSGNKMQENQEFPARAIVILKSIQEPLMTCSHITFWRSVLLSNYAAASSEKYLYCGDETKTPMGSLANCQFPNLVFKCMLFFSWYPVTDTIPSLYFRTICPCCLSEKKKVSIYNSHKFCLSGVLLPASPLFFSQLSGVQYFSFGAFLGNT